MMKTSRWENSRKIAPCAREIRNARVTFSAKVEDAIRVMIFSMRFFHLHNLYTRAYLQTVSRVAEEVTPSLLFYPFGIKLESETQREREEIERKKNIYIYAQKAVKGRDYGRKLLF